MQQFILKGLQYFENIHVSIHLVQEVQVSLREYNAKVVVIFPHFELPMTSTRKHIVLMFFSSILPDNPDSIASFFVGEKKNIFLQVQKGSTTIQTK